MSARAPKSASERGKASRVKGARFENDTALVFRSNGYPKASRTQDGRAQAERGDISGGPDGFYFECKRRERMNVAKSFDEMLDNAPPLAVPVLIHRPNRHEIMATLPLDDLIALIRRGEL